MLHDLHCYCRLAAASFRSSLINRFSLVFYIFGLGLTYLSSFFGIWIIMQRFGSIGAWTLGQIVFIYMLCLGTYGIGGMIFINLSEVGNLVKRGELDVMLLRPINPVASIIGVRFEMGGFGHFFAAIAIFLVFHKEFHIDWTAEKIVFFVLTIFSAILIQGAIRLAIGACAFYITDTGGLNNLYNSFREFAFYPVTLFNGIIKFILFAILPMAFVSYVPAGIFLDNPEYAALPHWVWKVSLLYSVVLITLASRFWKIGLRHYSSTGS